MGMPFTGDSLGPRLRVPLSPTLVLLRGRAVMRLKNGYQKAVLNAFLEDGQTLDMICRFG
jgi:hypothetical protein